MDKDRIKGSAEQAKGKVKEVAGKVWAIPSWNPRANQVKGKMQNAVGGINTARQVEICRCVARTEGSVFLSLVV